MKKKKLSAIVLVFLSVLMVLTSYTPNFAQGAMPESNALNHYNKHGDKIQYMDDGSIYFATRGVRATSGIRWRTIGWRVKVTANGRTAHADYSMGIGLASGFTNRSPAFAYSENNSGGYYYQRFGLNYNYLIRDISAKNSTLGRDMASGDHDVKVVYDSIVETYNAVTQRTIKGPLYTASSTKSALREQGMSTAIVDDWYGRTINIGKSALPIVKYRNKAISFPNGGGYNQNGTTSYVQPGKLIYVDSTYRSQKVDLTQQYLRIGGYATTYNHSSRNFTRNSDNSQVNWNSGNSSGPAISNANSDSRVRNAFTLSGTGGVWSVKSEARNRNNIYDGGHSRVDKELYVIRTDSGVPTFSGLPSTAWSKNDISFTAKASDSLSGIKVATLKRGSTTLETIRPSSRTTTVTFKAQKATAQTTYTIEAEDNVGNKTSRTFTANVDKGIPGLTVAKSTSSWTNGNVTLNATATDALSGVASIRLPNGNVVNGAKASQTVSANGNYTFRATDKVGNIRDVTVSVTNIDKTAPAGTLTQSPTAWTNGNVTLRLASVTDSGGSGLKNIKLPNGSFVTGTSATHTVSSNGTYTFTIYDNAGNSTNRSITVSNIDKSAPNGNVSQSPTGWTNGNVNLTLSGATDTGGSGVDKIKLPNGSFVNGTSASQSVSANGTYNFVVYDKAGNTTTKSHRVTNIDKNAPTGTLTQTPTAWTKGNVTLNLTNVADTGGSGLKNIKLPNGNFVTGTSASHVVSSNGTYTFTIYDNAGNATNRSITVTNIDKTAPTGTLTRNPSTWTNGNVNLTLGGISDGSGSGIKHTVRPNGTTATGTSVSQSVTTNGNYTFKIIDNVGNESTRSMNVTNIDKEAPNATLNPNSAGWRNSNLNVTVTPSDTGGSGVKNFRTRISTNNGSSYGAWSAYSTAKTGTVTLSATGLNRIQVEVNDNAGNTRTVTSGTYSLDKVQPTGSVSANTTAWINGNVTLTINASDADSGLDTIRRPDGSTVSSSSTTHTVTSNGTYSFVIRDKAGNERTVNHTVSNIDKTAPTANLNQTPTGWTNGNVTLNLTSVSDAGGSGLRNIQKPDGSTVTGTSTSHVVTENGTYNFIVRDNAGNSTTKSITVSNIDKTAPAGNLTQTPTAWTKGNVTLNVSGVSDSQSGIDYIKLPNGNVTSSLTPSYTVTKNGSYSVEIFDKVGNKTVRSINVTNIDKTAPTLTLKYDYNRNVIQATATDAGSGIASITLPNGNLVNSASATFTPPGIGRYNFIATDKAGNTTSRNLNLESPELGLSIEDDDWTNQDVEITAEASTGMSPIDYILLPNGQKVTAEVAKYKATSNGTYTFKVYDKGGFNSSETIRITNIDKVKPTGKATLIPGDNALTIRYEATDDSSGVKEITLPNGNGVENVTASFTVTNPGTYTAVVEDNAGNKGNIVATVQAPTVTVRQEVTSWTNAKEYSLTATTTPRYATKAKLQAPFVNNTWVGENQMSVQVTKNGTYEFNVNDGGIKGKGSINVTNFDRIQPVISFEEKEKTKSKAVINVKIKDVGDNK